MGPSWCHLGAILGPIGASWAPLGAILEEIYQGRGRTQLQSPLGSPINRLLDPSWSALGRSWGRLGALLGLSWGLLGPSWSHLEASEGHRKRKGEKAKNTDFLQVFDGFWLLGWPPWEARKPLGAVLGRSWGLLEHLGSHLERSCAILSHLGGHLRLSEALLEPCWAILGAPTTRETPRPGPGAGVGGG